MNSATENLEDNIASNSQNNNIEHHSKCDKSKKLKENSPKKVSLKKSHKNKKDKKSSKTKKHKKHRHSDKSENKDIIQEKIHKGKSPDKKSHSDTHLIAVLTDVPTKSTRRTACYRQNVNSKDLDSDNSRESSIEILYEEKHEVVTLSDSELAIDDSDETLKKRLSASIQRAHLRLANKSDMHDVINSINSDQIYENSNVELIDISNIPIPQSIPLSVNADVGTSHLLSKKRKTLDLKLSKASIDLISSGMKVMAPKEIINEDLLKMSSEEQENCDAKYKENFDKLLACGKNSGTVLPQLVNTSCKELKVGSNNEDGFSKEGLGSMFKEGFKPRSNSIEKESNKQKNESKQEQSIDGTNSNTSFNNDNILKSGSNEMLKSENGSREEFKSPYNSKRSRGESKSPHTSKKPRGESKSSHNSKKSSRRSKSPHTSKKPRSKSPQGSKNSRDRSKSPHSSKKSRDRSKSPQDSKRSKSPHSSKKSGDRAKSPHSSKKPRDRSKSPHSSKKSRDRSKSPQDSKRSKSPHNLKKSGDRAKSPHGSKKPRGRSKSPQESKRSKQRSKSPHSSKRSGDRSKSPHSSKKPRDRSKSLQDSKRSKRSKSSHSSKRSGDRSKSPRDSKRSERSKSPHSSKRSGDRSKSPHSSKKPRDRSKSPKDSKRSERSKSPHRSKKSENRSKSPKDSKRSKRSKSPHSSKKSRERSKSPHTSKKSRRSKSRHSSKKSGDRSNSPKDSKRSKQRSKSPHSSKKSGDRSKSSHSSKKPRDRSKCLQDSKRSKQSSKSPHRSKKSEDRSKSPKDSKRSKQRSKSPHSSKKSRERSKSPHTSEKSRRSKSCHSSKKSRDRSNSPQDSKRSKQRSKSPHGSKKSRKRSKSPQDSKRSRQRSKSPHSPRKSRKRSKSPPDSNKSRGRSKSHSDPKRSRERSHSQRGSRRPTKKSKHLGRSRDRSREKSPASKRQRRSCSDDDNPSFKIDKAKLRQIAIKNALQNANLVAATQPKTKQENVAPLKPNGKSLEELTEFCKKIAEISAEEIKGILDGKTQLIDEEEMPFIPARTNKDMKNGPILNPLTLQEKMAQVAEMSSLFPVSSGNDHRDKEINPSNDDAGVTQKMFGNPTLSEAAVSETVAKELDGSKPKSSFSKEELMTLKWVSATEIPGQFKGSTGVQTLSQQELSGSYPLLVKKDALCNAPPLTGGIGKLLLKKMGWKEGEGLGKNNEGMTVPLSIDIKTDRKGLVAPEEDPDRIKKLALERALMQHAMMKQAIFQQAVLRQALMSQAASQGPLQMLPPPHGMFPLRMPSARPSVTTPLLAPPRLHPNIEASDFPMEKHPISVLTEVCSKRHWDPPEFILLEEYGPAHNKMFKFKILLNGMEYMSPNGCPQKKTAKMEAAIVCLKHLGLFPQMPNI